MNRKEDILLNFLEQFPILKGNAQKPCIIFFDGYTGMGKTTVAKCIQKHYPAVILNNDEVRNFLHDYQDKTSLKDFLQKYRLEKLLQNHNHCIYDSCFCHNYEEKLSYAKKLGYSFYIVRLECSEKVIKKRLEKRKVTKDNFSISTFNDYLWMKNHVKRVPLELIDFTIYTDQDLEPQIVQFVKEVLEKENFNE